MKEGLERTAMEKLLEKRVMELSISWLAANIVFVSKKDGDTQATSDFRSLNDLTITDTYPMEKVRTTMDWLSSKRILSTFDLQKGSYQVELEEDSRKCTAVRTFVRLLQYNRLAGTRPEERTRNNITNLKHNPWCKEGQRCHGFYERCQH